MTVHMIIVVKEQLVDFNTAGENYCDGDFKRMVGHNARNKNKGWYSDGERWAQIKLV